jgi:hypothetical protein
MRGIVTGLCVLALSWVLAGCTSAAQGGGMSPTLKGDVSQCEDVYVYAPAVYVIPLANDQMVALDPLANDFPIFCEPAAAQAALAQEIAAKNLPGTVEEWKVYRVYGSWEDLATPRAAGGYLLSKPAELVDWVN